MNAPNTKYVQALRRRRYAQGLTARGTAPKRGEPKPGSVRWLRERVEQLENEIDAHRQHHTCIPDRREP